MSRWRNRFDGIAGARLSAAMVERLLEFGDSEVVATARLGNAARREHFLPTFLS